MLSHRTIYFTQQQAQGPIQTVLRHEITCLLNHVNAWNRIDEFCLNLKNALGKKIGMLFSIGISVQSF